jgi:protein phosphatase
MCRKAAVSIECEKLSGFMPVSSWTVTGGEKHMGIQTDCHGMTDAGPARGVNSDQFLVASLLKVFQADQTSLPLEQGSWMHDRSERKLLMVADGLGNFDGARGVSGAAVATLTQYVLDTMPWFYGLRSGSDEDLAAELNSAIELCDRRIHEMSDREHGSDFLATTLAMAYVVWPRVFVVRVGNCSCHVYRSGNLHPVPDETGGSNGGHEDVLVDALGGAGGTRTELYKVLLDNDDVLLLCTDGVTRHLDHRQIATVCDVSPTSEDLCRNIIGAVREAGARDNSTVVAARFWGL